MEIRSSSGAPIVAVRASRLVSGRCLFWFTGVVVAAVLGLAMTVAWTGAPTVDLQAYWSVNATHPYVREGIGPLDVFQYSPVAAMVAAFMHVLPFGVAATLWRLGGIAVAPDSPNGWAPGIPRVE